jgi:Right handed beta helix region
MPRFPNRLRYWCGVCALLFSAACEKSPSAPDDLPTVQDQIAPPQLSCPEATSGQTGPIYYVAMHESGADNERCDGLSPVDRGNGRCPFKDFNSQKTFALLRDAAGVRVEVRRGVYTFAGEGLTIRGRGNSEASRVVLAAYENEAVAFDGRNTLRELIRISGTYTALERVAVRNAGAYNVQVGGGSNHLVQCNRFLANMASDSLKAVESAGSTLVRFNDFSEWDSQAIDMADAVNWTISDNDFHDPKSATGNAIGAKFGSRNILITGNRFLNTRGLSFGGVSSAHPNDFEAYNLVAEHNTFENFLGAVVKFYSCSNCAFRDNAAKSIGGGFILGGEEFEGPSGCAGGCRPTEGATIERNRLTELRGRPANTFWFVFQRETNRLVSGGNVYCTPPGEEAQFSIDNRAMTFSDWTRAIRTDSSSSTGTARQGACLF